ncbi:MAG: RpiB/LacA/LacB family sugar-phosphate isomerase [Planctomycetota bacterium]
MEASLPEDRSPRGPARLGRARRPARGAQVRVVSAGPRPQTGKAATGASTGRPLVTENCLRDVADGADFHMAVDAHITPGALEQAQRRGIRLVRGRRAEILPGFGSGYAPIVAIGCDHGGFALKQHLLASLSELGYRPLDVGTRDTQAADYPDYAHAVARAVAEGRAMMGVCIDGAGIGSTMAAAKVPGILPANCWDERTAANAREHNHANVLCLGAGHLSRSQADAVLRMFLGTPVGPGRHAKRVDKIRAIEDRYRHTPTLQPPQ